MDSIKHLLFDYLISVGVSETASKYLNMLGLAIALSILVFIIDFIIRKLLIQIFSQFASRTKTNFDDLLVANKVPRNIAHIIPLLVILEFVPYVLTDFGYYENLVEKGLMIFSIILALWIVRSILNSLKEYLKTSPHLKDKPIDSYIQVFMNF